MSTRLAATVLTCAFSALAVVQPSFAEPAATQAASPDNSSASEDLSAYKSAAEILKKIKGFHGFRLNSPPARELRHASDGQLCGLLGPIADEHDLPLEFFWRLIWQESRFNP